MRLSGGALSLRLPPMLAIRGKGRGKVKDKRMETRIETTRWGCYARLDRPQDAFAVRQAVFSDEQGYSNEFDALDDDPSCIHLAFYKGEQLIGCARITSLSLERRVSGGDPAMSPSFLDVGVDPEEIVRIGRVAVLPAFRHRGFGSEIVRLCEEVARRAGARVIKLHAQEYIQHLYAACGFDVIGEVDYEDEGQPHVWMAKRV